MEGSSVVKYWQSKTQLSLTEYRLLSERQKEEIETLKKKLRKAEEDRKWAMEKLQDAQEQNRQLGMMITYLTERGGKDVKADPGQPRH